MSAAPVPHGGGGTAWRRLAEHVFCTDRPDSMHLSPGGARVSWTTTARPDALFVAPVDDLARATAAVEGDGPVRFHTWAPDGRGLLRVRDDVGGECWQIVRTDLTTGVTSPVSPAGVHADLLAVSPRRPAHVLLAVDDESGLTHVHRYDMAADRLRRVVANPGAVDGWFTDPALRVRAATAATADGGFDLLHRVSAAGTWRAVLHVPSEHALTTLVVSLPDPTTVMLVTSLGSDTTRLAALDTVTGDVETLAACDGVDAERVLLDPATGWPDAVSWYGHRRRWQSLSNPDGVGRRAHAESARAGDVGDDLRLLERTGADVRVVDRSRDDRRWLVALERSAAPTAYALWRRDTRALHRLDLPGVTRSPPAEEARPIRVRARDGLELHGYWRPPPAGRAPWPTVLMVHGGPWWRDTWEHDPWRDWIGALGFACLQVDFRGSTGRGSAFAAAGVRRWGREVIDDLDDSLSWAVERGWSDRRRLVAFGSSFGGYAALMLAARGSVAAAAAHNAPTDLVRFLEAIPAEHPTMPFLWRERFGDVGDPAERRRLAASSPLGLADRFRCPVLLACGDHDARVPPWHTDAMAAALRAAGTPVRVLHLTGDGHELQQAASTVQLAEELALLLHGIG